MTDKPNPNASIHQGNTNRLLKRLTADSLARQLVDAHTGAGGTDRVESARAVLRARLERVRGKP